MKMTTASIKVNDIIRKAKEEGISIRKIWMKANLSEETIRRWRLGLNDPGYENFTKFERAFIYLMEKAKK